jgi:hypothetical protein
VSSWVRVKQAARTPALLAALLGSFLIPIMSSNLRGITHLVDCRAPTREAFEVSWDEQNRAVITGSSTVTAEDSDGICTDVDADVGIRPAGPGRVLATVRVRNDRATSVLATVIFDTGSQRVPVKLGRVLPGSTSSDRITVRGGKRVTQIRTELVVGP